MADSSGPTYAADELRRFAGDSALAAGVPEAHMPYFVEGLVQANLRGVDTHGVFRLPSYVRGFRTGNLDPAPDVRVVGGRGAAVVLDGGNGIGVVVGQLAADKAVETARDHGIGVVAVRNSNHSGMLAGHVLRAARAGMIGHFVSNAPAFMAAWGGAQPVISNGPLAWAVPRSSAPPIVLDMACSAVARTRIRVAAAEGRSIPAGWAVDSQGQPTEDATAAMEGSLMPIGGHKGYGLAVINEVLAGPLAGARLASDMSTAFLAPGATTLDSWGAGHLAVAIDVGAFAEPEDFNARMDRLVAALRSSAGPSGEVLLPGEPEQQTSETRTREGVPLSPVVAEQLEQLAAEQGIAPPQPS